MLEIEKIHHIAIICSNYELSKHFYTEILPFTIQVEHYRAERQSYKLDLCLNGEYVLELFSFPSPAKRVSRPEACGGRHLAFAVRDLEKSIAYLESQKVTCKPIRQDEYTGKHFTFLEDPDGFPIELYEI
jgi:lactoylglutathione lyase